MPSGLVVLRFRHGPFWNFSYLAGTPGGEALVIDPAWDVPAILAVAESHDMRIAAGVLSHGHRDHVDGLPALIAATGAGVIAHLDEEAPLRREYDGEVTIVGDRHELTLDGHTFVILHTPGHTQGSLSLYTEGAVFTGDTLMTGGPGRHGHHPGAAEQLLRSVGETLGALPPGTIVYPGHDEGPEPFAPLNRVPLSS